MRLLFWWVLAGFAIVSTGCAPKVVSVCGTSGGQCCAVAPPGSSSNTYYACIKDNQCPPPGISGTPTFPETQPPSGRCEVVYKDGWIWERSAAIMSAPAVANFQAAPASFTDSSGKTLTIDDPSFCTQLCSADDQIGRCPRAIIPNDVSTGILSLAVDLAENQTAPDQLITMDDLAKRFNATNKAMSCDRDSVVYASGAIDNSGTQCVTLVSSHGGAIKADLTMKTLIHAETRVAPKIASFTSSEKSMNLKISDSGWDQLLGGDIQTAGRVKATDLATKNANQTRKACMRLRPQVVHEKQLDDIVDALASNPAVVAQAIDDVRVLRQSFKDLPADVPNTDAGYPELMPISRQLQALDTAATGSAAASYRQKRYTASSNNRTIVLKPEHIATALDIYQCSATIGAVSYKDYDRFFPTILSSAEVTPELMETRNRLAGKLLLCTYGAERLTPAMKDALKSGIARLGAP